jgi:hypothetical protein
MSLPANIQRDKQTTSVLCQTLSMWYRERGTWVDETEERGVTKGLWAQLTSERCPGEWLGIEKVKIV